MFSSKISALITTTTATTTATKTTAAAAAAGNFSKLSFRSQRNFVTRTAFASTATATSIIDHAGFSSSIISTHRNMLCPTTTNSLISAANSAASGTIKTSGSAHRCSRLFGSPARGGKDTGGRISKKTNNINGSGTSNGPMGTISIYDEQTALNDIDIVALRDTIQKIAIHIGYETYDVTLILVDDEEMQETNLESRGINQPTDILSFPFHEPIQPGLLEEPEFDIPDYYNLGDMMIDVPYVIRRCQEDEEDEIMEKQKVKNDNDSNETGEDNVDVDVDDVDDDEEIERGVSGAMAGEKSPHERLHMLLVHGMLHLVGYDHEDDDEYNEMIEKEEEILKELKYL